MAWFDIEFHPEKEYWTLRAKPRGQGQTLTLTLAPVNSETDTSGEFRR